MNLKRLTTLFCICTLVAQQTIAGFATTSFHEDSFYTNRIGKRVNEMTPAEQAEAGIVDPFSPLIQNSYRTIYNRLAFITGTSDWTVYSTATGNVNKGFVSPRERVYVYNDNTNPDRYYIEFKNYGVMDTGYIQRAAVKVPSKNYTPPINSGYISADFHEIYMSGQRHQGIDVATATGTRINAVAAGEYIAKTQTAIVNGTRQLVNFGNYITSDIDGVTFYYAHLSKFAQGQASTLESGGFASNGVLNSEVSRWNTAQGSKIGETGNTGNSTGPHLHFEIRKNGISVDPFGYVVFPDIGY